LKTYYTDRSRILDYQRCGRRRYEGFHRLGSGISSIAKPLPLAVGGSVHEGFAVLLLEGQRAVWAFPGTVEDAIATLFETKINGRTMARQIEEQAVATALADFAQYKKLEIDTTEFAAMTKGGGPQSDEGNKIAETLGLAPDDPAVLALQNEVGQNWNRFDEYLRKEQTALVEAIVRAYARRRLRPLLEEFEILEVEREGQWQLYADDAGQPDEFQIVFMSRPDALLRHRVSNELEIISFKSTASWDVRKARDAEHDMQGLSEGVEIEQRLNSWWADIHRPGSTFFQLAEKYLEEGGKNTITQPMAQFLKGLSSPPRISAIRYEYILKGQRRVDKELSEKLGMETRTQGSHLVRGLLAKGMAAGDEKWCWSWNFKKDDGSNGALHYKTWHGAGIWEHMTIAQWIDKLDAAVPTYSGEDSTSGLEPRLLGYQCDVQSGFTETHPLEEVFIPPITVFRNDDDLRDWIDSTGEQEARLVEGLVQIERALTPPVGEVDHGYVRHLMNKYFDMRRQACEWPTTCSMVKICYGSAEIKIDPISSGFYEVRTPNHPQERGE
jgi:hypothetical protein